MTIVWSYGGGVQSAAIGVLIREGALPRPDLAVIADTGRERRTTWDYLKKVMQPYLWQIGLSIQIADHGLSRSDLYARDGTTLVPAYTAEGRLAAFCSGTWKRDVIERWLRERGVRECQLWIGYSMDELGRAKKDHRSWCHLEFPLIEKWINRAMCVALIQKAGLPVPSKSRCWCCPHQDAAEWAEVRADTQEWDAAIALEHAINQADPRGGPLYLHAARIPLAQVGERDAALLPPLRTCDSGFCWT
jgi:hypothetical protein